MELQPRPRESAYTGTLVRETAHTAQLDEGEGQPATTSLRIGTAALHLTLPDGVETFVPFNLISKTYPRGETFVAEGRWSDGHSVLGLTCGAATASRIQDAVKAAVVARFAAVQALLQESAAAAAAAGGTRSDRGAAGPARLVLVVDAEKKHRTTLRTLLSAGGQHALFVKDGFEALEIYDTDPTAVACILTELKPTEDMTGWQLAREIRHREHGAERERTPIFAMTSKHYDETAEDTIKVSDDEVKVLRSSNLCHSESAGMDGYMMKPPSRTKLRTLLTQYLAARHSVGGARVRGGLMTQAIRQSEGGEDELFDEALAEFYAKEHWFPRLFFLPFFVTRRLMRSFWYLLSCYGVHIKGSNFHDTEKLIIF